MSRYVLGLPTIALFFVLVQTAPGLAASCRWAPQQVTTDPNVHTSVVVSGDRLAWQGGVGANGQIFTWRAGEANPTQLTSDDYTHSQLQTSEDRVVWESDAGATERVFTWSPGTGTSLVGTCTGCSSLGISGNLVVWQANDDSDWNSNVHTWQYGDPAPTQLTTSGAYAPKIQDGRVVWTSSQSGGSTIWTWKAPDTAPSQVGTVSPSYDSLVSAGDRIAWSDHDAVGNPQIYAWASGDTTPTQLTSGVGSWQSPKVCQGTVVWCGVPKWLGPTQLFVWTPGSATSSQITTGLGVYGSPVVSSTRVFWYDDNPPVEGALETWSPGDAEPMRVTGASLNFGGGTQISGNRFAWIATDASGSPQQVFTSVPVLTTAILSLPSNYVNHDVTFTLAAIDLDKPAGITSWYTVGASAPVMYGGPVTVSSEGRIRVAYWSIDGSGSAEPTNTVVVRIDKTAPTLTMPTSQTYFAKSYSLYVNASDRLSGLSHTDLKLDGGAWLQSNPLTVKTPGPHTLYARAIDQAGNERDGSVKFSLIAPCSLSRPVLVGGARHSSPVAFSGTASPAHATKITVTIQRSAGSSWRAYKGAAATTNASGTWNTNVALAAGVYRLQASCKQTGQYQAAASKWTSITVK